VPKRYRRLRAKPGQLRAAWAKPDEHNNPDLCYSWGEGTKSADGHLMHWAFSSPRARTNYDAPLGSPRYLWSVYDDSFLQELEKRGYDLTTLKFSIQKKVSAT
jgi:hypothetical protein